MTIAGEEYDKRRTRGGRSTGVVWNVVQREELLAASDPVSVVVMEARPEPPGAIRVPLLELTDHHCHWPLGKGVPKLFCGAPVKRAPYCGFHARVAFVT